MLEKYGTYWSLGERSPYFSRNLWKFQLLLYFMKMCIIFIFLILKLSSWFIIETMVDIYVFGIVLSIDQPIIGHNQTKIYKSRLTKSCGWPAYFSRTSLWNLGIWAQSSVSVNKTYISFKPSMQEPLRSSLMPERGEWPTTRSYISESIKV